MSRLGCFVCLFAAMLAWTSCPGAYAATIGVQTGKCDITITVNLEIFGDLATQAHADKMKQRAETIWNGPSGQTAEVLGSNLDIAPATLNRSEGPEALDINRNKIDDEYNNYLEEFGLSENNCAYLPCCRIHFRTNIIVREAGAEPTEGYHQIEIKPDYKEVVENGVAQRVRNDSFVYKLRDPGSNPPTYHRAEPGETTSGEWRVGGGSNPAEAHEMGHLMGLGDTYLNRGASVQPGHSHDLMNSNTAFPFEDAMSGIVEFFGLKCDCCPEETADDFWQDYAQTALALGDAVAACNRAQLTGLLDSLKNQRKEVPLVDMPVTDLIELASSLDHRIEEAEQALIDCPPERPVTGGGAAPDGLIYVPAGDWTLSGFEWGTDSTKWCTYGGGVPEDGDDPRDAPPPTQGTPEDGDDPRDTPKPPSDGDDPRDTPTPEDDGDDPRDVPPPAGTPDDGDDPRDAPPPGDGFDPNDLPEIDLPGTTIIEEDDEDDPRDTPTSEVPDEEDDDDDDPRDVPVFVKAKTALLEGAGASEPVAGQVIKFFDSGVADMDLPSEDGAKVDTAYNEDPLQCTTDSNGDCKIDVPETTLKGSGIKLADGVDYIFDPKAPITDLYGIEFDVTPTQGEIIKVGTREKEAPNAVGGAIETLDEGDLEYTAELTFDAYKYYSYGSYGDVKKDWSMSLNDAYTLGNDYDIQIDYCRDKQPGPPLGWEPVDYDEGDAVPSAVIRFDAQVQP